MWPMVLWKLLKRFSAYKHHLKDRDRNITYHIRISAKIDSVYHHLYYASISKMQYKWFLIMTFDQSNYKHTYYYNYWERNNWINLDQQKYKARVQLFTYIVNVYLGNIIRQQKTWRCINTVFWWSDNISEKQRLYKN